jgi:hypothetical protein
MAVVVSESAASAASLDETVQSIGRFAGAIDVIGIPRLAAGICGIRRWRGLQR